MYSMTGYASKVYELENFTLQIDIRSLNSRYLDIRFRLPYALEVLEERLRKMLKSLVKRGKVDVSLKLKAHEQFELESLRTLIEKYYSVLKRMQDEMDVHFQVTLSEILTLKSLINPEEETFYREIPVVEIENVFSDTLQAYQESRLREGELTKEEILHHIEFLEESLERVSTGYPAVVEKFKLQLRERIQELIDNTLDENRVMTEVGIFANKIDISEEVSRIRGHIGKMRGCVFSGESCGKELDFVIQELNREINTIGSKVPDYAVAEEVVNMKTCLEKIKEQVRNIE